MTSTSKMTINVDLLDIPRPEVLINSIRKYTPQQIAEFINKDLLNRIRLTIGVCSSDDFTITGITIDITNFCVGYTDNQVAEICKQVLDKYRSYGYLINAKVVYMNDDKSYTSLEIGSIQVPINYKKESHINPPPYEEIVNSYQVKNSLV